MSLCSRWEDEETCFGRVYGGVNERGAPSEKVREPEEKLRKTREEK